MIESKKERMLPLYYFLFFILGIIFAEYISPLLGSILEIIMTKLEITKGKYGYEVTKINQKINNLADESGPQQAIGFVYSPEDEDYQEAETE